MKQRCSLFMMLLALLLATSVEAAEPIAEPGDEIYLKIVGVLDETYPIADDGTVDFDLWGQVNLKSLSQNQIEDRIKTFLGKYIRFDNVQTFLTLKKRPLPQSMVRVSVFGEVRSPGAHLFEKGWNVLDYIVKSGGTTRFALTDSVKLICAAQNRTAEFNLQLFSQGKLKSPPKVEPGCGIYVPEKPADEASWLRNRPDQVIHIFGRITRPGRYEFEPGFSLLDVLSHAGGVTLQADATGLRVISRGQIMKFDLEEYLEKGGRLPTLRPGDTVFVPERLKTYEASWTKVPSSNSIYIMGQIKSPGRYDFIPTLSFFDILSHAGGPVGAADLRQIRVMRQDKLVATFDLRGYLLGRGGQPPRLYPEDTIFIPSLEKERWVEKHPDVIVNVLGQVRTPGRYEVEPENLNIIDILTAVGGTNTTADLENIRIIRRPKFSGVVSKVSRQKSRQNFQLTRRIDSHRLRTTRQKERCIPPRHIWSMEDHNKCRKEEHLPVYQDSGSPKELLVTVFNFDRYQKTGDPRLLPEIRLGDAIFVPTKGLSFFAELKTVGGVVGLFGSVLDLGKNILTFESEIKSSTTTTTTTTTGE